MDFNGFIHENIFEEKEKYIYLYELLWANLEEDGFVITDEEGCEIDATFKAIAIKNIINEFVYRVYDEFNETNADEAVTLLDTLGISEEEIYKYCKEVTGTNAEGEKLLSDAFDTITETIADKLLELFSADDLFDYIFTATYDFEQDFTFAFEDVDEFQAFVDSNTERLDEYKEEYPAVMSWIEGGMIV